MLAGVCLVVLFSLAFGGYHYDPLDGSYSFVGAFSSKNQLGLFSSLGHLFRLCQHRHPARTRRLATAGPDQRRAVRLRAGRFAVGHLDHRDCCDAERHRLP